jgi:hypothetical protein
MRKQIGKNIYTEVMLAALKKVEKFAFKATGDEFLMWVQEAIAKAEAK